MWAEVNGERKKVACGPCIRGHRSSKCDHRDRVLVEVRKPGRPLSSCPHPSGSCSCERVVINYTIPKTSECACPSGRAQPVAPSAASGRVQKQRLRKSVTTFNTVVLERAIKANQDGETDTSSLITQTPTSETNSPPSSASSTPRLLPSRKASQSAADFAAAISSIPSSLPTAIPTVSSCCQPKPAQQAPQQLSGSCCSKKAQETPKPDPPVISCCGGGAKTTPQMQPQFTAQDADMNTFNSYSPYSGPFQTQSYNMLNQGNSFIPMAPPFNFKTPIYNHVGSMFHPQQPSTGPMTPMLGTPAPANDHNCHCGDSCSCFGCAAHPNNATMMEYIRSMHQYMSTGHFTSGLPPTYDLPTYPHHHVANTYGTPNYVHTDQQQYQMSFQHTPNTTMSMPGTPLALTNPWTTSTPTPGTVSTPLRNLESQYFPASTTTNTHTTARESEPPLQSPTFGTETTSSPSAISDANKDTPTNEDLAPTLSPSSYFWQEVVLPGCNDATGTCQCGDGCECVGCLTHGGHNGVVLDLGVVGEDGAGAGGMDGGVGGERDGRGGGGGGGFEDGKGRSMEREDEFKRFVAAHAHAHAHAHGGGELMGFESFEGLAPG